MMKKSYLFFPCLVIAMICFTNAQGQITKGNWMMGGSARFIKNNTTGNSANSVNSKQSQLTVHPRIGYFILDKFSGGVGALISRENVSVGSNESISSYYSIGPFVRYYFLPVEKQINFFSEMDYFYSNQSPYSKGDNSHAYNILIGTVAYFNKSVGVELTLEYTKTKTDNSINKSFQIGLGFQIHLEKEGN